MKKTLLTIVCAFGLVSNVTATSNEDFAKQVQQIEKVLANDKKAMREAEDFCTSLPEQRRNNEPRCAAMQKILSKEFRQGASTVKSSKRLW